MNLQQIFNIADKTVLLTGAAGYLGRHFARGFLSVGANVILMSRSDQLIKQLRTYEREFSDSDVFAYQLDNYDRERFEKTLRTITRNHRVDVIVNNAYDCSPTTGFNTDCGELGRSSYDQWVSAFESGIYWAVVTTQTVGQQLVKRRQGSIINISSMYANVAPDPGLYGGTQTLNPPTYSTMKTGLCGFTRYVASFWGKYNVRCNAVLPGPFPNTESQTSNSVEKASLFYRKLRRKVGGSPLRRLGKPAELLGVLIYLASDASSFMTGQCIVVDGGWTIR